MSCRMAFAAASAPVVSSVSSPVIIFASCSFGHTISAAEKRLLFHSELAGAVLRTVSIPQEFALFRTWKLSEGVRRGVSNFLV